MDAIVQAREGREKPGPAVCHPEIGSVRGEAEVLCEEDDVRDKTMAKARGHREGWL